MRYHISEEKQFSCDNSWLDALLKTHCSMVSWYAAYKCHNTKDKILNLTLYSLPRNRKIAKMWKNRINCTDLPKIIALCEEHSEES